MVPPFSCGNGVLTVRGKLVFDMPGFNPKMTRPAPPEKGAALMFLCSFRLSADGYTLALHAGMLRVSSDRIHNHPPSTPLVAQRGSP
jgi:hypothetical protein